MQGSVHADPFFCLNVLYLLPKTNRFFPMTSFNPKVDPYFIDGCGRCALGGTPACKVNTWREELELLRAILIDCGLTEELKWSHPCYTYQKTNIVLIGAFKDYCALMFVKGALLADAQGILTQPTENSESGRQLRLTSPQQVISLEPILKAYIYEAIEVEKAGLKVAYRKPTELNLPDELTAAFESDPVFKKAFEALTPGRQKGYILHFSGAKQSATRASRIEKCMPMILAGKGLLD